MNNISPQGPQSYQIQEIQPHQHIDDLRKDFDNNGQVEIIIENNDNAFVVSGEKININEFESALQGKAATSAMLEVVDILKTLDKNKDGFLEEQELKRNYNDTLKDFGTFALVTTAASTVIGGIVGTFVTPVIGTIDGAISGATLGAKLSLLGGAIGSGLHFLKSDHYTHTTLEYASKSTLLRDVR